MDQLDRMFQNVRRRGAISRTRMFGRMCQKPQDRKVLDLASRTAGMWPNSMSKGPTIALGKLAGMGKVRQGLRKGNATTIHVLPIGRLSQRSKKYVPKSTTAVLYAATLSGVERMGRVGFLLGPLLYRITHENENVQNRQTGL